MAEVGQHIVITTTDGHILKGKVVYAAPDRLMLVYAAGMHVVYRNHIANIQH